jgi:hypothetical protein
MALNEAQERTVNKQQDRVYEQQKMTTSKFAGILH